MPLTDRATTAVLTSLPAGEWTLLGSTPRQADQGWDTLEARWICDYRQTARTPLQVAAEWRPGAQFGSDMFWLAGGMPVRVGGNVWQFNATYKGQVTTAYSGGATTNATAVVTMTSTAGLLAGMSLLHANLPAMTYILTVDSSTQVTVSANATASGTGLTLLAARPPRLVNQSSTESQSAESIDVSDGYGSRTMDRASILEAAPSLSLEYIAINRVPPTTLLSSPGLTPAMSVAVRSSHWSSLASPTENWPSGWVLTGCPAELLPGTNTGATPNGVWLVTENWQYRYRFAP